MERWKSVRHGFGWEHPNKPGTETIDNVLDELYEEIDSLKKEKGWFEKAFNEKCKDLSYARETIQGDDEEYCSLAKVRDEYAKEAFKFKKENQELRATLRGARGFVDLFQEQEDGYVRITSRDYEAARQWLEDNEDKYE